MPTYINQNHPGGRDWKIVHFIFELSCLLAYFLFLPCKSINSKTWPPGLCVSRKTEQHIPSLRLVRTPEVQTVWQQTAFSQYSSADILPYFFCGCFLRSERRWDLGTDSSRGFCTVGHARTLPWSMSQTIALPHHFLNPRLIDWHVLLSISAPSLLETHPSSGVFVPPRILCCLTETSCDPAGVCALLTASAP